MKKLLICMIGVPLVLTGCSSLKQAETTRNEGTSILEDGMQPMEDGDDILSSYDNVDDAAVEGNASESKDTKKVDFNLSDYEFDYEAKDYYYLSSSGSDITFKLPIIWRPEDCSVWRESTDLGDDAREGDSLFCYCYSPETNESTDYTAYVYSADLGQWEVDAEKYTELTDDLKYYLSDDFMSILIVKRLAEDGTVLQVTISDFATLDLTPEQVAAFIAKEVEVVKKP